MKNIIFVRHAKAVEENAENGDMRRPLDAIGKASIIRQRPALRKMDISSDLVLCSPARRTRETYEGLCDAGLLNDSQCVEFQDDLYMATATKLYQIVKMQRNDFTNLIIIGHNPGLHQLALALVGVGAELDLNQLAQRFPPFSVASVSFDANRWDDVALSAGTLDAFIYPDMSGYNAAALPGSVSAGYAFT
ncbi:MAG: histidine phosphatase family protein [Alphaproteobacteria bacterium]|jgi:phosphohistidine phosphatase|nr:histidine phosphatase family protein [Thalassospira sp.]MCE2965578.1 histidine phosphatase family protein [Alphaproteobacteria bacterium]